MAQVEDIFAQVDEQLEADRVQKYWEKNQKWIVLTFVLFFIALFAYVGWQEYRQRQDRAASDIFLSSLESFNADKPDLAKEKLSKLMENFSDHGYATLGELLQARLLAQGGDVEGAIGHLESLATRSDLSGLLRDLALLNAAYLTAKDRARAVSFLARIDPNSPYQPHALELQGLLASQAGEMKVALDTYRKAIGLNPAASLRKRLELRIEKMGEGGGV
ncbi:MAG: tetratricopeptide repeat protein [Magnetococcus sp. DMHC-6]